ncbi:MAG: hypothetical protein ABUS48_04840 [Pseudomonadota bacterium]
MTSRSSTLLPLPPHFEAWAKAEVEAGRAASIVDLAAHALELHLLRVDQFRATLRAQRQGKARA